MPPCWGGTQVRIRLRDPRPQLREHRLQDPHSSHTPCTARKHVAGGWAAPWPRPLPSAHQSGAPAARPPLLIGSVLGPRTPPFEGDCRRHKLLVPTHTGHTACGHPTWETRINPGGEPGVLLSWGGTQASPGKGSRSTPPYPIPTPPHPRPRARIQQGRQGQDNAPPDPKHVDTQIDMTLYMDTDTKSSHRNTALPQPFASSCTPPVAKTPFPGVTLLLNSQPRVGLA